MSVVAAACLSAAARRDAAVGDTAHHVIDLTGKETDAFVPRHNIELDAHSNIGLTVLDASGRPINGVTVNLDIVYPRSRTRTKQLLESGKKRILTR